jgi:signal transduction histidine kinase/ActR/RegA family two-component response regulator
MKPNTVASTPANVNSAFRASRPQYGRLSHPGRFGRPGDSAVAAARGIDEDRAARHRPMTDRPRPPSPARGDADPSAAPPRPARSRADLLVQLELLEPGADEVFDQIARIAAHVAQAPAGLVGFFGAQGPPSLKGRFGWQGEAARLHPALCAFDRVGGDGGDGGVHLIADSCTDARLAGRDLIEGEPDWCFHAAQPVRFGGQLLGAVCVLDRRPRRLASGPATASDLASDPASDLPCEPAGEPGDLPANLPQVLADLAALVTEVLQARDERVLRRAHERRAADLARASGDWGWETDSEHRYSWLSSNFEEQTGTGAAFWLGQQVRARALLDAWGDPLVPGATILDLLQARQRFSGAMIDTTMLGTHRVISISAVPQFDATGRFRGFRGITKDVTQQVAAQRKVREQQMRQLAAEQASKNKSELLSRVSHEFRTPLNAILGFSQLAMLDHGQPLPPAQRRRVEAIHAGGERLLTLINDMLEAARAEQAQRALAPTVVDLQRACSTAVALLLPLAEAHGVTLVNRLHANTLVVADEGALGQVLLNLLSNAIKYNRRGGAVRMATLPGEEIRLLIEDEGVGLSADQVAMLFQPFNRLGAEQTDVAGTGLGLVISKTLVDAMGGALAFESHPGAGTCVILTLPAAPGGLLPSQPPAEAPALMLQRTVGARQRRVLYVEDDAVNAMLMRQLFQIEPAWQLDIAATGAEALAQSAAAAPDLILLDMNLPDMSGLDVLRTLRARGLQAPRGCVAVSADAMPHQIDLAMKSGCTDYWTKPLDLAQTWKRLERLLGPEITSGQSAR